MIVDSKNIQEHVYKSALSANYEWGDDLIARQIDLFIEAERQAQQTGEPFDLIQEARKRADKLVRVRMTG